MKTMIGVALSALLVACGGGGGGGNSPTEAVQTSNITVSGTISVSSYINTKELSTYSSDFPNINGTGIPEFNALAYSFFRYPDGTEGVFTNVVIYNTATQTPATASPARMIFWARVNGAWTARDLVDAGSVPNCIHPRKSLPADYNGDGVMDFVLACHGWDTAPLFPGERNRVVLSQPNGKYKVEYFNGDVGFWHGGASQDFNGDGYPDVALTDSRTVSVYLNNGRGQFGAKSTDYTITVNNQQHYSLELVDVNNDGRFDVLLGGHEFSGMPTTIVFNPGNNRFAGARAQVIPAIPGAGVVLDFTYSPATNSIFVVRTGDGWGAESIPCNNVWTNDGYVWYTDPDCSHASFYTGILIQKYSLSANTTSVVFSQRPWTDPRNNWPWMPWARIRNGRLNSDWGAAISTAISQ